MDPLRHAGLLRQCGITWYVLRDPAGALPALPRCVVTRPGPVAAPAADVETPLSSKPPPLPADERQPPPVDYDDSMVPAEPAADSPAAARRLLDDALTPAPRSPRAVPAEEAAAVRTPAGPAPAPAVDPYHLLVVAYENVALFVCGIKSARLSPAWEQSARGFLDDVVRAIIHTDPSAPRLDYFSWPLAGRSGRAQPRGDATEVTASFLQGRQRQSAAARVFLMGEVAHRQAGAFTGMSQLSVAQTHGLGEFFTQPQLKADLWDLLRQGA